MTMLVAMETDKLQQLAEGYFQVHVTVQPRELNHAVMILTNLNDSLKVDKSLVNH